MSMLYRRRQAVNVLAMILGSAATLIGLLFLAWILWVTISRGISAIGIPLFTKITAYADQGGLANAITGSLIINSNAGLTSIGNGAFPALTSIGGFLTISNNAQLSTLGTRVVGTCLICRFELCAVCFLKRDLSCLHLSCGSVLVVPTRAVCAPRHVSPFIFPPLHLTHPCMHSQQLVLYHLHLTVCAFKQTLC